MSMDWRALMTFAAVAIAIYLGIIAAMYTFQRSLMYQPGKNLGSPMASGLPEMVAVNLKHPDQTKTVSWYKSASTNKPTLIYFQGNAGNIGDRRDKVRPFLDVGMGVMLVGYRGYGNNQGTPTEEGLYSDATLALEFLSRTGIMPDHWILYGESLGSAVTVEVANRHAKSSPVAAVILEAPFSSMTEAAKSHYPWLPVSAILKDKFESISKIKSINAPLMIIHGSSDNVVPISLGKKLFNAAVAPKTKHWIDGASHNDVFEKGGSGFALEFIRNIWANRSG